MLTLTVLASVWLCEPSKPVEPTIWRVTAYCPCEKSVAQYSDSLYNIGNELFERITDEKDVQTLWGVTDWATIKVVFPSMPKPELGSLKPKSLYVFLQKMRQGVRQESPHQSSGRSAPILLAGVCKFSKRPQTDATENSTKFKWVYFSLEAKPSTGPLKKSLGTYARVGEKDREIFEGRRISSPHKSHRRRQQAGKSFVATKSRIPPKNTQANKILDKRIYTAEKTSSRTNGFYSGQLENMMQGQVVKVTAYCPCA